MPTFIGQPNRSLSNIPTAIADSLVCKIDNGDAYRQIIITHLNYGYSSLNSSPPTFGYGAAHIIQGIEYRDNPVVGGWSPRQPVFELAKGQQIFFDNVINYGARDIDFNTPLIIEPGLSAIVVVPSANTTAAIILADQVQFLTVTCEFRQWKQTNIAGLITR